MIYNKCNHKPCMRCKNISADSTYSSFYICCRCHDLIKRYDNKHDSSTHGKGRFHKTKLATEKMWID